MPRSSHQYNQHQEATRKIAAIKKQANLSCRVAIAVKTWYAAQAFVRKAGVRSAILKVTVPATTMYIRIGGVKGRGIIVST